MKGFVKYFLLIGLGAFLFASCASKRDFTTQVRKQYGLKDEILPKIQFFIAEDIVLYKADSESGLAIQNGEVVVTNSASEDQIIIKAGTKGAFVKSNGPEKVAVRFESGEGRFLMFSGTGNYKGRFMLAAEKWENKKGVITYNNEKFYVTNASGASYLQFKLKKLNSYKKKSRVASGVDVN